MAINLPIVSTFDGKGVTGAIAGIQNLGAKLLGFGAIVAGAFVVREVIQFGRSALEAAENVQVANRRLEAVAKATQVFGAETGKVTDRLIKFAEAQEMVIAADAEVIKGVQAQLLSFKKLSESADTVGGTFDRVTKAAFDMAAAGFGSAESNAIALGKAFEDPIKGLTALRRSGTVFTEEQQKLIRTLVESGDVLAAQEVILAELESQYGGTAEATASWSDKLTLAFDNVKEAAGKALLPAFEGFAKYVVEEVIPPLTSFFEDDFPGILKELEPLVTDIQEGFQEVGDAIKDFLDIPDDVSLLEGVLDKLGSLKDNPTFQSYIESVRDAIADIAPEAKDAVIELGNLAVALEPTVTGAVENAGGAVGDLISILTDLSSIVRNLSEDDMPAAEGSVNNFESTLAAVASRMPGVGIFQQLAGLREAFNWLATTVEENAQEIRRTIDNLVTNVTTAFTKLPTELSKMFNNLLGVFNGGFGNLKTTTQNGVNDQVSTVTGARPMMFQAGTGLITSLSTAVAQAWPNVQAWFNGLPGRIRGAFGDAGSLLASVGRAIIDGLLNGLQSAWNAVANWVREKANWIKNTFAAAMRIRSPSKVFFEFGENIMEGLLLGLQSMSPAVDMQMGDIIPTDGLGAASASGGMRMGGGIQVVVNAGMGTNGAEVGRLVVNAIRDYERRNGQVFAAA